MTDEAQTPQAPPDNVYINLSVEGDSLSFDSSIQSESEVIFWLEVFKQRIINKIFEFTPPPTETTE